MLELNIVMLSDEIAQLHLAMQRYALKQVDNSLTLRNWLIGCYIIEYEQSGQDRAAYGAKLLSKIGTELKNRNLKGLDDRYLRHCRGFYANYPQLCQLVLSKLQNTDIQLHTIWRTLSSKLYAIQEKPECEKNLS